VSPASNNAAWRECGLGSPTAKVGVFRTRRVYCFPYLSRHSWNRAGSALDDLYADQRECEEWNEDRKHVTNIRSACELTKVDEYPTSNLTTSETGDPDRGSHSTRPGYHGHQAKPIGRRTDASITRSGSLPWILPQPDRTAHGHFRATAFRDEALNHHFHWRRDLIHRVTIAATIAQNSEFSPQRFGGWKSRRARRSQRRREVSIPDAVRSMSPLAFNARDEMASSGSVNEARTALASSSERRRGDPRQLVRMRAELADVLKRAALKRRRWLIHDQSRIRRTRPVDS